MRIPGQGLLDDQLTVGPVQVDPIDLVATTLRTVCREAVAVAGSPPQRVVISVRAIWVRRQRTAMLQAAKRANLRQPELVTFAESIVREREAREQGQRRPFGAVVGVPAG